MNILTVGKKQDIPCMLKEIARQDIIIKNHKSAVNALIHLQKTKLKYDWVILDKRETNHKSQHLFDSISNLCQCHVLAIPNDNHSINYTSKPRTSDTTPSLAIHSSQLEQQTIESLNRKISNQSFNVQTGIIEYHIPCARKEKNTHKNKPHLRLVTNNTVR